MLVSCPGDADKAITQSRLMQKRLRQYRLRGRLVESAVNTSCHCGNLKHHLLPRIRIPGKDCDSVPFTLLCTRKLLIRPRPGHCRGASPILRTSAEHTSGFLPTLHVMVVFSLPSRKKAWCCAAAVASGQAQNRCAAVGLGETRGAAHAGKRRVTRRGWGSAHPTQRNRSALASIALGAR